MYVYTYIEHTRTTPHGGKGYKLWLANDHGPGGWNPGPYILYIYRYIHDIYCGHLEYWLRERNERAQTR